MPALEVKPGVSLFYLDSGAPDPRNESYMTLFMLHGHAFHSPIFSRAIALSGNHNIRFVAITRRDYPGSSLLSDEDVKAIVEGTTETRLQAFVRRAEEILLFIKEFINLNNIPSINSNGGGGFSLCGWSMGNLQSLSVLAFASGFPDLVRELTPYFRSYISYDLATLFPLPLGYHPMWDESIPKAERGPNFCQWISSYFTHPPEGFASGDATLLNQKNPSTTKPSTLSQFTAEERATNLADKLSLRAEISYYKVDPAVLERILHLAFSLRQQDGSPPAWPNVPTRSLLGEESPWVTIYNERALERWIQQLAREDGDRVRSHETVCVPKSNHFLYWDEPEKFLEMIKPLML